MTLQGRGSLTKISVIAAAFLIFGANCGPAAAATSSSASALQEIDAFAGALSGVSGYGATVTIYDQKDTQTQNVVFDYTFSKPSNVTVHVTGGPNTGVTLDWNGGSTVVAHKGSGLAAMFSKTLSLHDPLVTTLRGDSIDQLSFNAILAHVQQQTGTLSVAAAEPIDGVPVKAVTLVPSTAASNDGLTREVLVLSAVTHLPMRLLGYEGSTLVRKIELSNVKLRGSSG